MKKAFLLCITLVGTLISYADEIYTIHVEAPQSYFHNATTADLEVSIQSEKGDVAIGTIHLIANADSMMIGDFNGNTPEAYSAGALWTEDPHCGFSFILEPGKIKAVLNGRYFNVSGTPLNDAYQAYKSEVGLGGEAKRISMEESNKITESYMQKYNDTPLFNMLFGSHYDVMFGKKESVERLYAIGSDKQKKIKAVEETYKRICHNDLENGQPFRDVDIPNATVEDSKTVRLSDYIGKGKWVFIDFWASWCGGCRQAIPRVKAAYEEVKDKNIMFISIAVWDKRNAAIKAMKEENMPWLQLIDEKGACGTTYMFNSIPRFMLFAPDGTIADKDVDVRNVLEIIKEDLSK